jgi:hypothetical protein
VAIRQEKTSGNNPEVSVDCNLLLVEVAWPTLDALAFGAFCDVFDFAILEEGLHRDFTTTRAVETVSSTGRTRVLAYRSHYKTPWFPVHIWISAQGSSRRHGRRLVVYTRHGSGTDRDRLHTEQENTVKTFPLSIGVSPIDGFSA